MKLKKEQKTVALYRKVQKGKSVRYEYVGDERWLMPYTPAQYLVTIRPGSMNTKYLKLSLSKAAAEVEAAMAIWHEGVTKALLERSRLTPQCTATDELQRKGYEAYRAIAGDRPLMLMGASYSDIADAGVNALRAAVVEQKSKRKKRKN